jgi:hypothetical protein
MNGPPRRGPSRPAVSPEDSQAQRIMDYPKSVNMLEEKLKTTPTTERALIDEMRSQLCQTHTDWILDDPASAAAADAVSRLWKKCFYERIAEARKTIARDNKKGKDTIVAKTQLSTFLKEGVALFEFVIGKLREKLALQIQPDASSAVPSLSNAAGSSSTHNNGGSKCLYRLFICLGDLYRYDEKLERSETAYATASRLAPGCAHCFNQRGVVSDCRSSTAVSTYWYLRAIYSPDKPGTAEANMLRLLTTNRLWLQKQQIDGHSSGVDVLNSNATRLFFAKFVDLFLSHYKSEPINPKTVLDCVNSFQTLLQSSAFSDSLLCKLIAILAVMDVYLYDFGLCLAERVVATLQKNPASRRSLTPLLLLVEYALLCRRRRAAEDKVTAAVAGHGNSNEKDFWQNVVTVWNLVSPQDPDANDVYLTEYEFLKGYRLFEPFVGKLVNQYLSDQEACASFEKPPEESPSARIVRFRSLKSALLELDGIVENAAGSGNLAFQDPNPFKDSDFFGVDDKNNNNNNGDDAVDFDQSMEYDEGEDFVLPMPTPVVPASKAANQQSTSIPALAAAASVVAPSAFPFGIAALMGQAAPAGPMTSLPLLSGHVAQYQAAAAETTTPPVLAHAFAPSMTSSAIGPPPGFGGLMSSRPSLFGDARASVVPSNVNSPFPINMTTANPFGAVDFNGNTAAAASVFQSSFAAVSQTNQSPNGLTKNPFAS